MAFAIGKKLKMSQIWKDEKAIPVTPLEVGPLSISQVKTKDKDGYEAVQLGYKESKKKLNKPESGHLKNLPNFKKLKEYRIKPGTTNQEPVANFKVGEVLDINQFSEGDKVKVSGVNKGRGFQGVVKRHGFRGGPKSHGQKDRHRAPGSIGATAPQRVMPGRKMAGHMGRERVTVKNLTVVAIDKEKNILFIKGAIPGNNGGYVEIRK